LKMNGIIEEIKELSRSSLIADERTKEWPLMKLSHALIVTGSYIAFVLLAKYTPLFSLFPKMELKIVRVIHNFLMTALNCYLVVELLIQAHKTSYYGPIFRGEQGLGMAKVLWLFYFSKLLEFNDTVIMIFRKAFSQVSFLHWYHHSSVFLIWWFNVLYYPGGEAYPSAWLNSFVHVWMYGYYLLSTLGFNVWWKRYLTQLQISQLSVFVIQGISLLFTGAAEFKFIGLINGAYAATLVFLFLQFYTQSYAKKGEKKQE